MSKLPFFDTNIIVYAYTHSGVDAQKAEELLLQGGIVSIQVLNEVTSVARGKFRKDWLYTRQLIEDVLFLCPNPRPLTVEIHAEALRISERYGFTIWDGLILASALQADCEILYTEDLQHGQVVEGLRIENPFLLLSKP